MKKEFHLTQEGVSKLKAELDELIKKRGEVANKLKTAREQGDLAENAEYQNARDEQVSIETKISDINHVLKNVEVISTHNKSAVSLGSTVALKGDGVDVSYTIVGSLEASPMENKISDESPIGQALMNKKVGDKVEIHLPSGEKSYTIKSIK